MELTQLDHTSSNSTGLPQYFGNLVKIACLSLLSSSMGSPGCSLHPMTVHRLSIRSPKYASRASFVANVGTRLTTTSLLCRANTISGAKSFSCSILDDWAILAFFFGWIGMQRGAAWVTWRAGGTGARWCVVGTGLFGVLLW